MEKTQIKTLAQNISLEQFVEGRSIEIASFLNNLADGNSRRCPQNVHRSLRRRAMSHNRFRIPRRLRMNLDEDLKVIESTQRIPKCRKSLRRKSRLLLSYKQRSEKARWLWTHLWSAKRMRMMDYFGYRIAHSPNDKSYRATYRFSRYGCCLIDMSYYQMYRFDNNQQTTNKIGQAILEKQSFVSWLDTPNRYFKGTLSECGQTVCPIYIFQSSQHLTMLFHPAAKLQTGYLVKNAIQLQNYQVYQLIGPQSLALLHRTLASSGPFLDKLATLSPCHFPPYFTTTLPWQYNQHQMISSPTAHYCDYVKDRYNGTFNEQLRKVLLSETASESDPKFWTQKPDTTEMKITTRSKYTHKRRNKLKKHEKQQALDRIRPELKPQKQQIVPMYNQPSNGPIASQFLTIAMAQSGCLIISNSNVIALWKKLSFSNAKVIGRHNLLKINYEQGRLTYPEDYPQTRGYSSHIAQLKNKNIDRYRKLPPNKRVNFIKINSPFPFGPSWKSLSKLPFNEAFKIVRLQMLGRGIPTDHSYICLPSEHDIELVQERLQESNLMEQIHEEPVSQELAELAEPMDINKLQNCQIQAYFKRSRTSRQIVGFVTTGGYSYQRSKGFCIGYVLQEYANIDYFLVRKCTSRHYFLAQRQAEDCRQASF